MRQYNLPRGQHQGLNVARSVQLRPRADIQYSPKQAWFIRDLLHDRQGLKIKRN